MVMKEGPTMQAEIEIRGAGLRGTVSLDGHDVSKAVRGFALSGSVGEVTRLELDLAVFEVTKVSAEVEVYVSTEVAALLEQICWTPPTVAAEPHAWQEYNAYGNTCHYPGCTMTEEEHT